MDPIDPIPTNVPRAPAPAVERLPPVSRERDRPRRERPDTFRGRPAPPPEEPADGGPEEDRPRVDIRA